MIIVGHGARFDREQVVALAEQLGAPVITTFKAKGQIADDHPLACGVLGRSGTPVASWFMNESDLLLVLGASFSNHTGIYPGKPIIQVDFDPLPLGKFHPVTVPVWGEIGVTVDAAGGGAGRGAGASGSTSAPEVAERWAIWRAEKASRASDDRGAGVDSAAVFAALGAPCRSGCGDRGRRRQQRLLVRALLRVQGGPVGADVAATSGSIGFGYPAAMGAWAAAPERAIFAVTGDGGFAQYMAELLTAVKHRMKIMHVLLNNGQLGKIAKEQRAGEWDVWQTSLHNPDFSQLRGDLRRLRRARARGRRARWRARRRRSHTTGPRSSRSSPTRN